MIPKISSRTNGQDLGIHLQNEHDNEIAVVKAVEGRIAEDLAGWFAEVEVSRDTFSKAKKELVSLSLNLHKNEVPRDEAFWMDWINRNEVALGLVGQPRAIVQHIKDEREHWHVVWSRIDEENERAIPMSHDYAKTMQVVREMALDYGIELPEGYNKDKTKRTEKDKSFGLYEKYQLETSGITKAERSEIVTELWDGRDTPESFLKSLEHHGYVLTNGHRPYILVDLYGNKNSLRKLIAHRNVNTTQIREFLGEDRDLPDLEATIEDLKAIRKKEAVLENKEARATRVDELEHRQELRREEVTNRQALMQAQQRSERQALRDTQHEKRNRAHSEYLEEKKSIQQVREERKATGLAAFLGRVTGVEMMRAKLHKHRDKQRLNTFQQERKGLIEVQDQSKYILQVEQDMKALEIVRELRTLDGRDKREMQSLHKTFELEKNREHRAGYEHMPRADLTLTPRGRRAYVQTAKSRHTSPVSVQHREMVEAEKNRKEDIHPREEFREAGRDRYDSYGDSVEHEESNHASKSPKKDRDKDKGRER